MKKLLVLFCFISLGLFSQKPPEQGDYVSRARVAESGGCYIFKSSKKVYYDFKDSLSYDWKYAYTQDAKHVKSYFKKLDKANLPSIKSVDENTVPIDQKEFYSVIEFKKEGKVYRICWDTRGTDKTSLLLNDLDGNLNSFW